MKQSNFCVCPEEYSRGINNRFRQWLHNPARILAPHVRRGMTCLDLGCGPGFFTLEMAHQVGNDGTVIAADREEGMLKRLAQKTTGLEIEQRIRLHPCDTERIGLETALNKSIDFILLFYVVHEIPDKDRLFTDLGALLAPGGRMLMAEPPIFVSQKAFQASLAAAESCGLAVLDGPGIFLSKTAILRHQDTPGAPGTVEAGI